MPAAARLLPHLEKLPYFVAIAEAGSFRKAAEKLRIAQPALSKSVRVLEEACGVGLFERRRTGVVLTEDGEQLLAVAREVLRAAGRFEEGLARPRAGRPVHFVTHELLLPLLASRLARLVESGKAASLHIYTNPSVRHLLDRIDGYEADCGVVAAGGPRRSLHAEPLVEDRYDFFCSKEFLQKHGLSPRRPLAFEELAALPLILSPNVLAGRNETLAEHLTRAGLDLAARHVVGSIESVAVLAGHGLGIGLLPAVIGRFTQGQSLVQLQVALPRRISLGTLAFSFVCRTQAWASDPVIATTYEQLRAALASAR